MSLNITKYEGEEPTWRGRHASEETEQIRAALKQSSATGQILQIDVPEDIKPNSLAQRIRAIANTMDYKISMKLVEDIVIVKVEGDAATSFPEKPDRPDSVDYVEPKPLTPTKRVTPAKMPAKRTSRAKATQKA